MKRVLVDTNALLSFLTDRDPSQQASSSRLLEDAAGGRLTLIVHQVVLTEMVYVLLNVYRRPADETRSVLDKLLRLPGVEPLDDVPWSHLLEVWPGDFDDFADALQAVVLRVKRLDSLATFDRGFARRLRDGGLATYW